MPWYEKIVGDLGDKKKYREYKARVKQLPAGYREATGALERYVMYLGPSDDGKSLIAKVNREDLWKDAAKELGVAASDIPASTSRGKETFFDGKVFDPENPAAYLKSLSIKRVEV